LTDTWNSAQGLAWSPSGDEVWFTASSKGVGRALFAVARNGKLRQVSSAPSSLRLLDIAQDGRVLIAVDDPRMTMAGALAGEKSENDLSKFDSSHVDDISLDGKRVLFTEGGEAGGQHYAAYLRDENAHTTSRIASGRGLALSPDGSLVLTIDPRDRSSLMLTSIGATQSQRIFGEGFEYQWAKFLPGNQKLIVGGSYPGESLTICTQSIDGGRPAPLNGSPYMDDVQVSPDGLRIAGSASHRVLMFDLASRSVRTVLPDMAILPVGWGAKGKDVYVVAPHNSDYQILKMSLQTGSSEPWKTIAPGDPGFAGLASAVAAPDTGAYVYSAHLDLSRLYVVDGWS
jgi:Tol biopolymer transport system component